MVAERGWHMLSFKHSDYCAAHNGKDTQRKPVSRSKTSLSPCQGTLWRRYDRTGPKIAPVLYISRAYCLFGVKTFLYFYILCHKWCVIERCGWELCTVQRWASNSQYWRSYGVWIFRRRAQNTKIGQKSVKIGPLNPSFYLFLPWPPGGNLFNPSYPRTTEPSALG